MTHAFIQVDLHHAQLEWPYQYPYSFISSDAKIAYLNINGQLEFVLLDCLKPQLLLILDTPEAFLVITPVRSASATPSSFLLRGKIVWLTSDALPHW